MLEAQHWTHQKHQESEPGSFEELTALMVHGG
jgi:hypothetical protein